MGSFITTGRVVAAKLYSYDMTFHALGAVAPVISDVCMSLGLDAFQMLRAFAHIESRCGMHIDTALYVDKQILRVSSRREPSYSLGGSYYDEALSSRWGQDAESSWGPLQVMAPNAYRYGLPADVDPSDTAIGMANVLVACQVSVKMMAAVLKAEVEHGSEDPRPPLEEIADKWNSGNFKDRLIPHEYIADLVAAYRTHSGSINCPELP